MTGERMEYIELGDAEGSLAVAFERQFAVPGQSPARTRNASRIAAAGRGGHVPIHAAIASGQGAVGIAEAGGLIPSLTDLSGAERTLAATFERMGLSALAARMAVRGRQ